MHLDLKPNTDNSPLHLRNDHLDMHQYNLDMHQYNLHHLHQLRYGAAFGDREPLRDGPQTELLIL